ncbi:M20 family metallo-hydrolase [soil metagenome]
MFDERTTEAVLLLQRLIATQSFSREEHHTADILQAYLSEKGIASERHLNNVVAWHRPTSAPDAPVLLLNSHHDTVKPGASWTRDPYAPTIEQDILYGLGSNDAGGALVTMLAAFMHLRQFPDLPYAICFAATAEEEISGDNGMAYLVRENLLGDLRLALVGEPTQMSMAIAEKGLMVLDCTANGVTGHAARNEGDNAIYTAMNDIGWIRTFDFERVSPILGSLKMTVTQISSGSQHNVVPDRCEFVVDVRTTEVYTNDEVLTIIRDHVKSDVHPRSMRLHPSSIASDHPLVQAGVRLGLGTYGSPTMSDQSLLPAIPSLKIGPGDSARSHTPNEYIKLSEIDHGITTLIALLEAFL